MLGVTHKRARAHTHTERERVQSHCTSSGKGLQWMWLQGGMDALDRGHTLHTYTYTHTCKCTHNTHAQTHTLVNCSLWFVVAVVF